MALDPDRAGRSSRVATTVFAAFLVGAVVMAALTPDRRTEGVTSSVAIDPGTRVTVAGDPSVGAVPGDAASTDTTTATGSTGGNGGAAPTAAAAPPAGAAGSPTPTAQAATSPAPGDIRSAPAGGNGGATFQGVTAKSIKIGHSGIDSNALGAVCPRCGDKEAPDVAALALVEAWRRDGKLPIYGRDIEVVPRKYGITPEERRNSCVTIGQRDKPFLVIGQSFDGSCTAREFKLMSLVGSSIGGDDVYAASAPYLWGVQPSIDHTYRNFAHFLKQNGLIDGQVLGIYSMSQVASSMKSFKAELAKVGANIGAELEFDGANSASSDAVAVQRFRTAGVTVAIITATLTEPSGFQTQAEAQGYRPKYPIAGTNVEFVDAVADVAYNADAQDRNMGMRTWGWEWSQRRPARYLNNPTMQYCLDAYSAYTKKTIDVYDNDAEIAQLQGTCAPLELAREAMIKAGPKLNYETFLRGLYTVKDFQTSIAPKVSYGPGKRTGQDVWIAVQYKRERWQPENNLWHSVGAWTPWWVK